MKVVTVLGTRPNFNKHMLITKLFKKNNIHEILVHTGQHYDYQMSQTFFDQLELPQPDYHFNVGSGLYGEQTAKILIETEKVLLKEKPDFLLVYGDVDSTMAAAIAASKLKIPIAHIEAGVRNQLKYMPEEINRIVTDHLSDILFAPTKDAYNKLLQENFKKENIFFTGDIIKDNILYVLKKFNIKPRREDYFLATVHRAENTDSRERLKQIFDGLIECKKRIIIPLHPRTKKNLINFNLFDKIKNSNIELIDPQGYIEFVKLISDANKVLTDSGGVRREAYILGKPLISLMEIEGEWWPETVECGWNKVVGPNKEAIIDATLNFEPTSPRPPIFGDGNAREKIINILIKRYKK